MSRPCIVVHGGVGSPRAWSDGCRMAADRGLAVLRNRGSALEAVTEATVLLEDDGRFNAGTGSSLRLDGRTVEMDAALMDSEGRIGAVAAVARVRNPILLARAVLESPHVLVVGPGAEALARRLRLGKWRGPSARARERYEKVRRNLLASNFRDLPAAWKTLDVRRYWNFSRPFDEVFRRDSRAGRRIQNLEPKRVSCDTVGAVARDSLGGFAAANSTGGSSPMLRGRVGDSPLAGCGFYAGSKGAVATTGIGEEIIRVVLAKRVYDWIAKGLSCREACRRGLKLFARKVPIGIIAITLGGHAIADNRQMASWASSL